MKTRIWERGSTRITRGGAWCFEWLCHAAYHNYFDPGSRNNSHLGFRLTRRRRE